MEDLIKAISELSPAIFDKWEVGSDISGNIQIAAWRGGYYSAIQFDLDRANGLGLPSVEDIKNRWIPRMDLVLKKGGV